MKWDIRREGRAWAGDEALERYALTPEKFEMIEGRLFWSDTDRVNLLAMLLENVGADRAVRLGNPSVWMEAVAGLGVEAEIVHGAVADTDLPAGAESLPAEARLCAGLLARFMSDLSEDYWAAGWLTGLEFELWTAVREEASRVGQANAARLRYLSSKCGGWIVWGGRGPRYVTLEEWQARYDEWLAGRASF
jgi:hypothetical protein